MCGIIGIATGQDRNLSAMLKESLLRLTYRGYDSYGVAIKDGDRIHVIKGVGRAEKLVFNGKINGLTGIGHTRWATHGAVSKKNAHPHLDCLGDIALVHNGIIDNYIQLQQGLQKKGHIFKSETDTEVIPHLIEENLKKYSAGREKNAFLKAFRDAIQSLEGTYAIAALWNEDGKIYAARRTSPLVIGLGQDTNFVASDISAFLEYTQRVLPLEDNRITVVSASTIELYNFELERLEVTESVYPFGVEEISKGKHKHFMLKEIQEQDTVLQELLRNEDEIENVADALARSLNGPGNKARQIYFTGCGSSFHAGIIGEFIFERLLHLPSKAVLASEFKTTIRDISVEDSIVFVLSQSGETLDTYLVLEEINKLQKKPHVVLTVNVPYSSHERLVGNKHTGNYMLRLCAKPEICVLATKTFTAQLYALCLLALKIAQKILPGDNSAEIMSYVEDAKEIPAKVRHILDTLSKEARRLAHKYTKFTSKDTREKGSREDLFVIGRGINLGTAYEAALKLREVCYISALGIAGGELKHGSLAAVDRNTPVIVLFPPHSDTDTWKSTMNSFMEVQARGTPIISICCNGEVDTQVLELSADVISVPKTSWLFSPILQMVFLHLFSYHMAIRKGINPDYPQHLAKTVTVE